MSGIAAPRKSGTGLHDPWERQVFALAVALCERGLYRWDEFVTFDREIAAERLRAANTPHSPRKLYEHWLAAFEKLVIEKGICTESSCTSHRRTQGESHVTNQSKRSRAKSDLTKTYGTAHRLRLKVALTVGYSS